MYVSPVVRSLRDDPIEGETVTLLVEVANDYDPDDDPVETVGEAISDAGGEIRDHRRFGTLVADVPHERLGAVCDVDGLGIVESGQVGTVDADGAGEDVDPDLGGE